MGVGLHIPPEPTQISAQLTAVRSAHFTQLCMAKSTLSSFFFAGATVLNFFLFFANAKRQKSNVSSEEPCKNKIICLRVGARAVASARSIHSCEQPYAQSRYRENEEKTLPCANVCIITYTHYIHTQYMYYVYSCKDRRIKKEHLKQIAFLTSRDIFFIAGLNQINFSLLFACCVRLINRQ